MQSVRIVRGSLPVFLFEYCIEIATNNDVFPSSRGILKSGLAVLVDAVARWHVFWGVNTKYV
ncbi:hypothetical protein CHLRE_29g757947v5 [Chlamydomonas reinhardtii]|uniref:Uncharacterized protein n=1 Tax=Chlamydomonas reinhardtii TaxID=3055 RepID=A0A2K3CMY6_CHLRE|nr:uncharacterized protein CHLRE_29g757947v5 [Chlamydomonas reinhardtii]PNW69650.1 hypothetical protein CHLRE_29g757947v5 [Chlamydomonas reinhardtii]